MWSTIDDRAADRVRHRPPDQGCGLGWPGVALALDLADTAVHGTRPGFRPDRRAPAPCPSRHGTDGGPAESVGAGGDPVRWYPWPRLAFLAHTGSRRGACRSTGRKAVPASGAGTAKRRL